MSNQVEDLGQHLDRLSDTSQSPAFSQLHALSDLNRERLAEFDVAWQHLPTEARRSLMQALVELAEASFEVNFDAIFRLGLDDPDGQVRASAIDGLWESDDKSLVGPFLAGLRSDSSVEARAAAAKGLGRYVLAGELDQLEQPIQLRIMTDLLNTIYLANESIEVRRRAVESVSYACTPGVLDALEMAYHDEDESMRISAVVGMGRTCDTRWQDILLDELESDTPAMRYEAAWAAGELALQAAVPALAYRLHDPDRQVRYAAIWALGQIGGEPARQLLIAAYDDADDDTQAALDEAMAEHALSEGNLDFLLYEVDSDDADPTEDEFLDLWSADRDSD
jgi:HEAT repeat protein